MSQPISSPAPDQDDGVNSIPLPTPDGNGACHVCGDLPAAWCPDCACCQQGCYGGRVDNACQHSRAPWL